MSALYRFLVDQSPDNIRRRSDLYLMAYCGLFLAFISGVRPSSSLPEMPALLWAITFLTGCLSLVLKRELRMPAAWTERSLMAPASENQAAQTTRLDRVASLVAKRREGWRSSLFNMFPEYESQGSATASPKTSHASRRDPFSSVLANLPDNTKRVDRG
jgi:hypothetical protein